MTQPHHVDDRPEFMVLLGLMPPYTLEDVKQAYLDKVKTAHPDHGGSIQGFRVIQEAYEQAQQHVRFGMNKRSWIAAQIERYTALEKVTEALKKRGAEVRLHETDWLEKSFGDFSTLAASVASINLVNSEIGRDVLDLIVANYPPLSNLKQLTLKGCGLTNDEVMRLSCFQVLEQLDISCNPVTSGITALATAIPTLKVMIVDETDVGWWGHRKLERILRQR